MNMKHLKQRCLLSPAVLAIGIVGLTAVGCSNDRPYQSEQETVENVRGQASQSQAPEGPDASADSLTNARGQKKAGSPEAAPSTEASRTSKLPNARGQE